MKIICIFSVFIFLLTSAAFSQTANQLQGAWKGDDGIYMFADGFYSYAAYNENEFKGTHGGSYSVADGKLNRTLEYNTFDKSSVGSLKADELNISDNEVTINKEVYHQIDDGTPGDLYGAWLISGRMQNGEIGDINPGPRKTMKILSGKRFQWIAYNTETKEFMGTGGGTYTTKDGVYTENIDFFSRDHSRVGASLPFEYELKDGKWHHKGNSSKGYPIHEVWSRREY